MRTHGLQQRPQRIVIAGDIGSGKSTVGRLVAAKLGVEMISTGAIQRRIAAAQGKTSLELNTASESDPSVDKQIDDYLVSLNDRTDTLVVESRMAWHFVRDALKVYLYCVADKAAERIWREGRSDEGYATHAEALDKTRARRASEVKRYGRLYGVDIEHIPNYDLVVDTTYLGPDAVAHLILDGVAAADRPGAWLSPRCLLPTVPVGELDGATIAKRTSNLAAGGAPSPVRVRFAGRRFHLLDNHEEAAAALRVGIAAVPARIAGVDPRDVPVDPSLLKAWQTANGFRYDFGV